MAASFVPITSIPQDAHPKDVPYLLGTLAPTDSILFTKQTLINFLKQQGIEVGPNCSELSRLPKYATFGKIVQAPLVQASSTPAEAPPAQATADVPASATVAAEQNSKPQGSMQSGSQNDPVPENAVRNAQGEAFRPTRRVREAIGGGSAQISALFGDDAEPSSGPLRNRSNESQSAASSMPAAQQPHRAATSAKNPSSVATPVFTPSVGVTDSEGKDFRPTRRVREPIGGGSAQIASLFGGDDSENDVPRRR